MNEIKLIGGPLDGKSIMRLEPENDAIYIRTPDLNQPYNPLIATWVSWKTHIYDPEGRFVKTIDDAEMPQPYRIGPLDVWDS